MSEQRPYLRYWHYWVLVVLGLIGSIVVGALVGMTIGINPYIAMSLGGGAFTLFETYQVAKHTAPRNSKGTDDSS